MTRKNEKPPRAKPHRTDEGPAIRYSERPAGRETLAAIAEAGYDVPREPASTRHYGDRISNAPGAVSPRLARALDDQPEIAVTVAQAGRETYAALHEEIAHEAPEIEINEPEFGRLNYAALEIQEMHTFLVRAPLSALEHAAQRRKLVERRLLDRLPVDDIDDVSHVDVRPWQEPGLLLVRVWCRLG